MKERIDLNNKRILVTGSAGFIGSNLVLRLFHEMKEGVIVGFDNLNDYYDPSLKDYRLEVIEKAKPAGIDYTFVKGDLADKATIDKLFAEYKFDVVVNLAAQAGVRYSIENPDAYIMSNMIGFYNILKLVATIPSHTWSMLRRVAFMVATRRCHSRQTTAWTILSACMLPRRRATNFLHIATASCITSRLRVCASSLFMVLPVVRIWRTSVSPINC